MQFYFTLTLLLICILLLSTSIEGKKNHAINRFHRKGGLLHKKAGTLPVTELEQPVIIANNAVGGFSSSSNSVSNAKSNNFLRLFVLFTVWYAFNAGCK